MLPYFNPQAPRGARLSGITILNMTQIFQSTGPSRGPTPPGRQGALRRNFNPQAPRGARHVSGFYHHSIKRFQSTGPSRGPTPKDENDGTTILFQSTGPSRGPTLTGRRILMILYFNPQAPRGARHRGTEQTRRAIISIHRPLAGPDPVPAVTCMSPSFQSTGPSRGPTPPASVLSPRACHFNPQAPRGARR